MGGGRRTPVSPLHLLTFRATAGLYVLSTAIPVLPVVVPLMRGEDREHAATSSGRAGADSEPPARRTAQQTQGLWTALLYRCRYYI